MASYSKVKIDPVATATQIWSRIKDTVAIAGCVEIRRDPNGGDELLLIAWFEEHVDWDDHQEIKLNRAAKPAPRGRAKRARVTATKKRARG